MITNIRLKRKFDLLFYEKKKNYLLFNHFQRNIKIRRRFLRKRYSMCNENEF